MLGVNTHRVSLSRCSRPSQRSCAVQARYFPSTESRRGLGLRPLMLWTSLARVRQTWMSMALSQDQTQKRPQRRWSGLKSQRYPARLKFDRQQPILWRVKARLVSRLLEEMVRRKRCVTERKIFGVLRVAAGGDKRPFVNALNSFLSPIQLWSHQVSINHASRWRPR